MQLELFYDSGSNTYHNESDISNSTLGNMTTDCNMTNGTDCNNTSNETLDGDKAQQETRKEEVSFTQNLKPQTKPQNVATTNKPTTAIKVGPRFEGVSILEAPPPLQSFIEEISQQGNVVFSFSEAIDLRKVDFYKVEKAIKLTVLTPEGNS